MYNALAYNYDDNYLYAVVTNALQSAVPKGALIKIGADGGYERVGTDTFVDAGDAGRDINMGAYNADRDELWMMSAQGVTIFRIDASTGTLIDSFPLDHVHDGLAEGSDWAFSGGELFSLGRDGIYRLDLDDLDNPTTATTTRWDVPTGAGSSQTGDQAGAAWTYYWGDDLGFSYNGSGDVIRIRVSGADQANPTFTVVAAKGGAPSGQNDGAASPGVVDLEIAKTGELINDDTQVRYILTVSNVGSVDAPGWSLSDTVPDGLENVVVSGDGSPVVSGRDLDASGGVLAVGDTRTVTVVADIGDADSLDNVAVVQLENSAIAEPNLANNEAAVSLAVPADPDDPTAPDTGVERTPMWPAYGALAAGLLLVAGVGGRRLIGRRDS